jgi:hypothetical protein
VSVIVLVERESEKSRLLYVSCCRYLEQSHDAPLKMLILTLQQEKAKLGADLDEALSRVSTLEVSVVSSSVSEVCI